MSQVLVVSLNSYLTTDQGTVPFLEGIDYNYQLFVIDVVVVLTWAVLSGVEGNRVEDVISSSWDMIPADPKSEGLVSMMTY